MSMSESISRIYVGNLPSHVSPRDVENEFRKYGNILKCDVKKTVSGAAFAFIEFEDARDAADAIKEKDGSDYGGNKLRVEVPFNARDNGKYGPRGGRGMMGRGMRSRRGRYVVEVSGLPLSGSWQDLKDHLREAGECGHADVFKNGIGEVSFFHKEDMLEAIEKFNGSTFRSHEGEKSKITIREKKISWHREDGGYGRYRSRNRSYSSRSYSRSRKRSYSRSRSYSSRSYSRSRSRSRSGSRSRSRSRSRTSSSSRSRSMDRRRDAYEKKRSYSRSLSYQERKKNNRSISKSGSRSPSRSRSRSSSWSRKRRH
ncbi:pre-mRNA-splicing factor, putative [Plasmodium knowlesi strain H]|uniref:Pre-mRNA-splicing factor, putative n=3 Tax=Plasmodium knowlesi TaxID=5850 RepID=A0A5K1UP12_PLAKH|nr:serine/arginine-rich splicing factor 1, putative [Plasmodium knowlesi strain H]OTN66904.1 putative Pre-mRNA-splicing factor [Plasmodium knowlesi]CAA9988666.1 serine/arginine-rich splicing factor 1, putative [Plasmodium knowlesi strain H]SBO21557.1 pre-mRNA-splicing factor, putative [Plasmodium knowlesi strain H]SBO21940.1 pre-mRNA-splicing factor, putative [Plasmodium knowlesi strain H]VVS78140.1 serine/arginine-rich splicing factor 1, putative [Plasmodium knowlesi strain H]|eukprot:XP_002259643.1 Splicing factor, putative [Plasmodium knowlesi strain H]